MNLFFYIGDKLITPPLEGTILPGVTRDSVIHLAKDWNIKVLERRISIDEIFKTSKERKLKEAFGSGTAAVISPVGEIHHNKKRVIINKGKIGPLSQRLYYEITGIQYGEKADPYGWCYLI